MRGDRYRDALTVIDTVERVRALEPEVLLSGHFGPITGKDRIHFELTRLRDAVQYVHDATVEGMNAGKDVRTLMREITLASKEQSLGIAQVAQAVAQLDQMTQQNASLVEESAAAAENLREQAMALSESVNRFQLA